MLSPEDIIRLAETMRPHLDKLNAWITKDMISRIMARLERGEGLYLTATDEWQAQAYKEAGGHYDALQGQIQAFTGVAESEIQAIFTDAGIEAWKQDREVYERNGYPSSGISERMRDMLESAYRRTNGTLHNFTRTTAQASQERLIRLLDETHLRVMTGAQSYTAAVKDAVNDICENQTKVKYPTGHIDSIETAVMRAVRTGVVQATGDMTLQGMVERDYDLIRVSAHLGARYGDGGCNPGNHAWWQGGLYSRTGRTTDLPPFVETTGYGTGEGLCGWNCRHSFGPGDREHNPYENYDSEANKQAYDLSQKQRQMEGRIRMSKRKLLGYETAMDAAKDAETKAEFQREYEKTASRLTRQNAAYKKFCAENGLKTYNERLQVAYWNRQQAAKAAAASRNVDKTKKSEYNKLEQQVRTELLSYSKEMNANAQNRHIAGSLNYDETRSTLTADPKELYNLYSGKSVLKVTKSGAWAQKEYFIHNSVIGTYRDLQGNKVETTAGIIRYSKTKGWHITPARPVEDKK